MDLARREAARFARTLGPLALAALAGCSSVSFVPTREAGFVWREGGHRHYVWLSANWSREARLPVLVYLHGGGESGSDGVAPTQTTLGLHVLRSRGAFPFIVVFPQCPNGHFWPEADLRARVIAAVDEAVVEFGGDANRVYLTGNSLGGFGTWLVGALHADRFAALVPIAGGARPPRPPPKSHALFPDEDPEDAVARRLAAKPVWAFHGARDFLVEPENSRRLVEKLRRLGAPVRYTEYPRVGHEAEDVAYESPELWRWLLAQRRGAPAP